MLPRGVVFTGLLLAVISLSGVAREQPAPIAIEIPAPFAERVPAAERSVPLGAAAPPWADRLYSRSLLVLHALTDPDSGAMIAGDRDGWRYIWPRDAASGALALEAAGRREQARRVAAFLTGLELDEAARFGTDGEPVAGRPAAGDARGWVDAAARATGIGSVEPGEWSGRQDYGENVEADLLGNAIAAGAPASEIRGRFSSSRGLTREAGGTALDSAAAWAVVPFARPGLRDDARRTLLNLAAGATRFGIGPTEDWTEGEAWSAPTAWSAWALARLGETEAADRMLAALHRSATPAGTLPERVSSSNGRPLSTTPLGWSHAFAVLALRERYPG